MIRQSIALMSDVEFFILIFCFGTIVATLGLFIVVAYLLITGKIKAIFFSIEGNETRDVMSEDEGGEKG